MKQFIFASLLILTACKGKQKTVTEHIQSPVSPTEVVAVDETELAIQDLVDEENDYRLGLGQTKLSPGLSCTLYTVTGGDRIQSSIAGHNTLTGVTQVATFLHKGTFNQPEAPVSNGLNVLPASLRSVYKNLYLLRCTGYVVVLDSGHYGFEVNSDDGSVLYVDGAKTVDNDNNHGPTSVFASKYLRKGVKAFRIDYAQTGSGSEALVIKVDGQLINPKFLYH